jgi:hypothetical protein
MTEKKKAPGATGAAMRVNGNEVTTHFTTPPTNRQAALRAALEREMDAALAADDLEAWQAAWESYLASFGAGGAG